MKEEDKRAVALNSLTSIGKEYVTLSDSTTIGKDVLEDLKKLMELELREKYKVNKTKWRVITPKKTGDEEKLSDAYHVITGNEKFMNEILKKFNENQEKIKKIEKEITDLKSNKKTDTSKYKKVLNELKELKKFFVIDMVPDIPISFNTIVKLEGETVTAVTEKSSSEENDPVYCAPYIELNKDPKEIATILNDKKELDKIFREKQFKSFDDMVILDFYNEITKKLSDTKDYLRKTDPDIRQDIIDDLYNKLFALYDIKEYYLKDRIRDKDEIKEKYIKEKIRKNNNLSIGGANEPNKNDGIGGSIGEGVAKLLTKGKEKYDSFQRRKKEKAEKYFEIDKLLHTITESIKNKSADEIDHVLNIKTLRELSDELNENSIYKQNIDDLIDIHDSLLSSNRDTLLAEQEAEAKEYIKKKKKASGEFVLEAIQKYKDLKKSFVDKVNKDKDDIEKMLEEEAGGDFAEVISFDDIVNNNSGTYIKKLKKLNSFLYLLDNKRQKGGAAPMYDVQKIKKDDGEQESLGNTPFDYYKKLKDTYIEIVNQYYKLTDEIGEEEQHYKFIYQYESLGIKDDVNTETVINNNEDSESLKNLKEAYKFLYNKVNEVDHNIFLNEKKDDDKHPSTLIFKRYLSEDAHNPTNKSTINYYKSFITNNNWKKIYSNVTQNFFDNLTNSLILIKDNCDDVNSCPNILELIKDIFKDTSTKGENENKLNELNEKIQLIENRIKLLDEIILKIPRELEKLYKVMKSMKGLSQATEYEDFVINILKRDKIEFFEKDKDKHPIIKAINNEKNEREDQLKKLKSQRDEAKKAIEDENAIRKAELLRSTNKQNGGGSKEDKYKTELKLDSKFLKEKYKTLNSLITRDLSERDNNLHKLMKNLKEDVEYLENNDDVNQSSDKSVDIGRERGIYEDIWYDYNLAVDKKDNKTEKWKNYLLYLTEGEKVHDRVIQNNLDPEIVLKIDFRDKSIYIFLMFLIRTINIIALEFLIEYNIIKSLQYTIMLYGFMYLFIISILIILVNYDSYKLRILFNYLNIHINSSNLLLQNILFIIFIILVYILVKSDDFLKYFGDLFDFTNIYNNIYKFNESLNEDSDINLTQNEKLKLLYRIDIISMIIFIFSALLVLIL